jgi:hypothetical protein
MTLRQLTLTLAAAALAGSAHAGTVTYATTAPTATGSDVLISNLIGTSTDAANVGGGADQYTYVAADRQAQGQFFTTGSNASGYTLNSVSLQHVLYSSDNTYYGTGPSTFTVRVTQPGVANALAVLGSETASVTGNETNNFGGALPGPGTGRYITFNLANPVTLAANTQYGFDVGSTADFFETNGNGSTSYTGGAAYTSGNVLGNGNGTGSGNASATTDTGARVFAADLTPTSAVPETSTTLSFGLLLAGGGLLGVRGLVARKRRAASAS